MTEKQEQPRDWAELAEDYAFGTWIGDCIEIPAIQNRFRGRMQKLQLLDIGCGYGKHAKFFNQEGAFVTGIDIADEMVVLARRNVPNAVFHCAPADNLSVLGSEAFDLIIAVFLFPNIKTVAEFYQCCIEIKKHLKPSGHLVIYDRHPLAFCNTDSELTKVILPPGVSYSDNGCQFEVSMRLKNNQWIQFYNYHWTFEHWHKQLGRAGFVIRSLVEPKPVNLPEKFSKDFVPFFKQPLHMMLEIEAM